MPKVDKPPVRVRFNKLGEPELNVADLRKSGGDLERLAEADKRNSTTLFAKGNDDGWLSPQEVGAAVGIHLSIVGGYHELVKEAGRRRTDVLPARDVAALMLAGRDGPIRKRVRPEPPPHKLEPILHARYDAAAFANATSPSFLRDVEQKIESAISTKPGHKAVYRGFSLENYGGPEMVRYLMGDWRHVIASHTFNKELDQQLVSGVELHAAVKDTAEKIAARVCKQIAADGYQSWAIEQSRATQIGIRDKAATGMATYPDSPLDAPTQTPTSFGYARTGFYGLIHDRVLEKTQPMIMIEVAQKLPEKFDLAEYYIPSHVPPTQVQRFFLGFSTWHDAHDYERPPEQKEQWYEVAMLARDEDGRPTEIKITPMKAKLAGIMESWSVAGSSWSSNDKAEASAFAVRHPLLAPTLAEITSRLRG